MSCGIDDGCLKVCVLARETWRSMRGKLFPPRLLKLNVTLTINSRDDTEQICPCTSEGVQVSVFLNHLEDSRDLLLKWITPHDHARPRTKGT